MRMLILRRRIGVAASLAIAATLLSNCAAIPGDEDPVVSAERVCMAGNSHFIDAWGCIQARHASGQMSEADPRIRAFLKLGDDLASQVAAKKLTDAEAKQRLTAAMPTQAGG